VRALLFFAAAFAVVATFAIVLALTYDTVVFFGRVNPWDFYTGTTWSPVIDGLFGVLPLIAGTLLIAGGATLIGIPLGLSAAIFLREYAPARVREVVKPVLEVLAGIPSIVFGFFALVTVSPLLKAWFGADYFNGLNAVLVIGIMVIPLVSSLSEDALTAVPADLRDGNPSDPFLLKGFLHLIQLVGTNDRYHHLHGSGSLLGGLSFKSG